MAAAASPQPGRDKVPDSLPLSGSQTLSWQYVAGVFDVSGSVFQHRKELRLRFAGYDRPLLERIRTLAGGGTISGERHARGTYYRLTITGRYRIARMLNQILPHLQLKRERVEDWLKLHRVKSEIASIRRRLQYRRGDLTRGKLVRRELREARTAIRQLTPPEGT